MHRSPHRNENSVMVYLKLPLECIHWRAQWMRPFIIVFKIVFYSSKRCITVFVACSHDVLLFSLSLLAMNWCNHLCGNELTRVKSMWQMMHIRWILRDKSPYIRIRHYIDIAFMSIPLVLLFSCCAIWVPVVVLVFCFTVVKAFKHRIEFSNYHHINNINIILHVHVLHDVR